ncbi:MAG: DUF1043 family protein [Pseudomonadota bacterium]
MFEIELLTAITIFVAGVLAGVGAMLLVNKLGSGSASPTKIKKEMEDYQEQVEAHFEETSKKFKAMANQYQDLYQHMSVGATTLCRPENIAPGLTDQSSPVAAQAAKNDAPPKKHQSAPAQEPSKAKPEAASKTHSDLAKKASADKSAKSKSTGKNTASAANRVNDKPAAKAKTKAKSEPRKKV